MKNEDTWKCNSVETAAMTTAKVTTRCDALRKNINPFLLVQVQLVIMGYRKQKPIN